MRDSASRGPWNYSSRQMPRQCAFPQGGGGKGRQSRRDYTSQHTMDSGPRWGTWYHAGVKKTGWIGGADEFELTEGGVLRERKRKNGHGSHDAERWLHFPWCTGKERRGKRLHVPRCSRRARRGDWTGRRFLGLRSRGTAPYQPKVQHETGESALRSEGISFWNSSFPPWEGNRRGRGVAGN